MVLKYMVLLYSACSDTTPSRYNDYCVLPRTYGPYTGCCKGQVYDRRKYSGCCDGKAYNSSSYLCCSGKYLVYKQYGRYSACCGSQVYKYNSQGCCNGQVYDRSYYVCCRGQLKRRSYGSRTGCCGYDTYNYNNQVNAICVTALLILRLYEVTMA